MELSEDSPVVFWNAEGGRLADGRVGSNQFECEVYGRHLLNKSSMRLIVSQLRDEVHGLFSRKHSEYDIHAPPLSAKSREAA